MKKVVIFSYIFFLTLITLKSYSQENQSDLLFSASIEYFQQLDYLTGLEYLELYLKKQPTNINGIYNKGVALYQLGDIPGACASFNKAIDLGFKAKSTKFIDYTCEQSTRFDYLKEHYYKGQELRAENGYRPAYTRKDTLRGMIRHERSCYDVTFYDLTVKLNPSKKEIEGNNQIFFKMLDNSSVIQIDLFDNLYIDSIVFNNKRLAFEREFDAVWVMFEEPLKLSDRHHITVYYHGKPVEAPNPPWDGGFVWKKDGLFNHYAGVACEQLGASVWWPNKDHLSDRPDSMGINMIVPKKYQAICNGQLRNVGDYDKNQKKYEWFVNYPINNYNATFYLGKFVEFTDTLYSVNDTLICRYHVLPKNLEKAKKHFKQAHLVVDFYNRVYSPFPFWKDNFRMVESPYEGMEHQTAIAYGNAYGNEKNAHSYLIKDYDYIIVHEAAHEWWGNAVSVADMADAWIHEGFATYSEYLFIEDQHSYTDAVKEMQNKVNYIFNVWPLVENRDVNEDAFASGDIYTKGAIMLHCLRATIDNDTLFFEIVKSFYELHKNTPAESHDFIEHVNKACNYNYTPFFEKFLYETTLPVLQYSYTKSNDGIDFSYKWSEVNEGFTMAFGLELSNGETIRLSGTTEEKQVHLKDSDTFYFMNSNRDLSNAAHNSYTYYWTKREQ